MSRQKRFEIIHGGPYEDSLDRVPAVACTECGRIDDIVPGVLDDPPSRCPGPDGRGGCTSDIRTPPVNQAYRDGYSRTFGHE